MAGTFSFLTKVAEFVDQSRRVCQPKSPSLPTKVAEFAEQKKGFSCFIDTNFVPLQHYISNKGVTIRNKEQ